MCVEYTRHIHIYIVQYIVQYIHIGSLQYLTDPSGKGQLGDQAIGVLGCGLRKDCCHGMNTDEIPMRIPSETHTTMFRNTIVHRLYGDIRWKHWLIYGDRVKME